MDLTHRPVEVQSVADIDYIVAAVKATAHTIVEQHLPRSVAPQGAEDVPRRVIEELVDRYIMDTFGNAWFNISINGEDVEKARSHDRQGIDHINRYLIDEIRAHEVQKESLTESVADLRRGVPQRAADAYKAIFKRSGGGDVESTPHSSLRRGRPAPPSDQDILGLGLSGDVAKTWESGTKCLVDVKDKLPETVAKAKRVHKVAAHLEAKW